MRIYVHRSKSTPLSTPGVLDIEGTVQCYTLERPEVQIPSGDYLIEIRYSPRFKRPLPHLLNVPHRSDILIHSGNWPRDTKGCLLVGLQQGKDMILQSRAALDPLVTKIQSALASHDSVTISIS